MTGTMTHDRTRWGGWARTVACAAFKLLAQAAEAVARERRFRREVAFLCAQSDYLLHDIGVTRNDVDARVRGRSA